MDEFEVEPPWVVGHLGIADIQKADELAKSRSDPAFAEPEPAVCFSFVKLLQDPGYWWLQLK